jgi:hypothetical protein
MNAHQRHLTTLFTADRHAPPPIETVICAFQADLRGVGATLIGRLSKESAREHVKAGRIGLKLARDAVRAGRLIDFGETGMRCSGCFTPDGGKQDAPHPFGGKTVAYSIAIPASEHNRSGRFVHAFDPRRRLAAVVEFAYAERWSWVRWVATAIGGEVFAERHGLAELFNPACCGRSLARLAAVCTLERMPFTCCCSRRLQPQSGYFRAHPPPPAFASGTRGVSADSRNEP